MVKFSTSLDPGPGHAGNVVVTTKKCLNSDSSRFPSFCRDGDILFGFNRLVQTRLPFSPFQGSSVPFVDNRDFLIFVNEIVTTSLVCVKGSNRLLDLSVNFFGVKRIHQRRLTGQNHFASPRIGEFHRSFTRIKQEVYANLQLRDEIT